MMIEVRNDVRKETGNQQQPIESTQLTGQFFFKPPPPQPAAKSPSTDPETASLRQEIARLQADQGALLKSQQEQLALLQKKLAEETKPAEAASPQRSSHGTDSRVIAVEPAGSGTNSNLQQRPCRALLSPRMPQPRRKPTKLAATEARRRKARLKLARQRKRRCRKAPRAKSSRKCLSSSSGSAAISAGSTAIGANVRNSRLSASTGTLRSSSRSMSRNRRASTP